MAARAAGPCLAEPTTSDAAAGSRLGALPGRVGGGFDRRRSHPLTPGVGAAVHDHRRAGDVATTRRARGRRSSRRPLRPARPSHRHLIGEPVDRPPGRRTAGCPRSGSARRRRRSRGPRSGTTRSTATPPSSRGRSRHRRMRHHRDPSPRTEAQEEDDASAPRDHPAGRDLVREIHGASTFSRCTARKPLSCDVLGRGGELTAGVVHQDVDARRSAHRPHRGTRRPGRARARRRASPARPAVRLQLGAHLLQRLRTAPADRDARPRACELARGGAADAGATPGDDGDRAVVGIGVSGERNASSIAAVWRSGDPVAGACSPRGRPLRAAERISRGGVG